MAFFTLQSKSTFECYQIFIYYKRNDSSELAKWNVKCHSCYSLSLLLHFVFPVTFCLSCYILSFLLLILFNAPSFTWQLLICKYITNMKCCHVTLSYGITKREDMYKWIPFSPQIMLRCLSCYVTGKTVTGMTNRP